MMWLVAEIVFIIMEPRLTGGIIVRSLKAFGSMNLAFPTRTSRNRTG